jgi:hypothetical protein
MMSFFGKGVEPSLAIAAEQAIASRRKWIVFIANSLIQELDLRAFQVGEQPQTGQDPSHFTVSRAWDWPVIGTNRTGRTA